MKVQVAYSLHKTLYSLINAIPKADEKGMLVRVLVSFVATAGLFYVNIMPALVDSLVQALNFSNQQAGFVASANVYGAALGALTSIFYVQKVNWRQSAILLLLALILIDCLSMNIFSPHLLVVVRFIHGIFGGTLVGIGFALIARTFQPDRTFGMLLVVQFSFGGLGMMLIPPMVNDYGNNVIYWSLILFSLSTLFMLIFIPGLTVKKSSVTRSNWRFLLKRPLQLTLISIFLFQAANMGIYAFIVSLGKFNGLNINFISVSLGWAAWVGIVGSILVIWLSTRFGLVKPLMLGIILTILGTWILLYSDNKLVWLIANLGVGVTWAFVMPYLFSLCAQLDESGQVSAMGGFASKLGLASGPVITGFLIGENDYQYAIVVAALVLLLCLLSSVMAARSVSGYTHL